MNKDFEIAAIARMIEANSYELQMYNSLKVGDGVIDIQYADYFNKENPFVGHIVVYSNGLITYSINNQQYLNRIYNDYAKISGIMHEPKPEVFDPNQTHVSNDLDKERFERAKQFVKSLNIELKYVTEEQINQDYLEKYEDVTVDDLVENSNKLEEQDYDEGEYHHSK